MQRDKILSIITIICFCTVIFIPIGLVLMCFFTSWKKKKKIIITGILSVLYVVLVTLLLLVEPSYNTKGVSLPGSYSKGQTAFEQENKKSSDKKDDKDNPFENQTKSKENTESQNEGNGIKGIKKTFSGKKLGRAGFSFLFFVFMLFLILWQNMKSKRKNSYENPYVDTNLYKLPFNENSRFPMVHFLRLRLLPGEKILFATETNRKDDEGDFVITSKRVVIYSLSENVEFNIENLEAVTSVSNSVMQLTSGSRKYYIFMNESQMKYALATVRWAYKNLTGSEDKF